MSESHMIFTSFSCISLLFYCKIAEKLAFSKVISLFKNKKIRD